MKRINLDDPEAAQKSHFWLWKELRFSLTFWKDTTQKGGGGAGEVRLAVYVFLTFSALSALSLAICSLTLCLKKKKHWNVRGKVLCQNVLVLINSELFGYEQTFRFGWGTRWVALGNPSLDPTPVDSHALISPFHLKRLPSKLANTYKTLVFFFISATYLANFSSIFSRLLSSAIFLASCISLLSKMKQKHSEEGGDNHGTKFQNNHYKKNDLLCLYTCQFFSSYSSSFFFC